jgi:phosphate transport system substrate-binding protein
LAFAACDDDEDGGDSTATTEGEPTDGESALSGSIEGDGSSTVYPIVEELQRGFLDANPDVDMLVGILGTGGGFERFCVGETDFNNASRPIEPDDGCETGAIEYEEFEVAYDGLAVMVNPANDFVDCLTVEELKKIWEPAAQDTITNWNQVRPDFPDQPLKLYGPGTDSGTFDYFTDVIVGEEGASRGDYTPSEDDNTLVTGIAGDENALGYFGFAYYAQNQDSLKLVAVDSGTGCIAPSPETVLDGTYAPLSRPLFVYVSTDSLQRPEVAGFMRFWMENGAAAATQVGYVEAPATSYEEGLALIP